MVCCHSGFYNIPREVNTKTTGKSAHSSTEILMFLALIKSCELHRCHKCSGQKKINNINQRHRSK